MQHSNACMALLDKHMLAWQSSTTNVYHGPVLVLGNLKHASMSSLLPVNCSRDDNTQIIICGSLSHGVSQTDFISAKQADLHLDSQHLNTSFCFVGMQSHDCSSHSSQHSAAPPLWTLGSKRIPLLQIKPFGTELRAAEKGSTKLLLTRHNTPQHLLTMCQRQW